MAGQSDKQPGPTATAAAAALEAELSAIRASGGWLPWTGFALALIWWAGAGAAILLQFGLDAVTSQGPAVSMTVAFLVLLPGLLIIVAATIAAENKRSVRANTLVLRAASQLLLPAEAVSGQTATLAATSAVTARSVEATMAKARQALKAASDELEQERARLESVAYTCADNTRDVVARLSEERRAIETLAREMRAQLETVTESVPDQIERMVAVIRIASQDIGEVDDALGDRMTRMSEAAETLKAALTGFDALTREASDRQDRLVEGVQRLQKTINDSGALTDRALKASEMATAAAQDTGNALRDAVAQSIEMAHSASRRIHDETRASLMLTEKAISDLKAASLDAIEAARGAAMRAPDMGFRPKQEPQAVPTPARPAPAPAQPAAPHAGPPPAPLNGSGAHPGDEDEDEPDTAETLEDIFDDDAPANAAGNALIEDDAEVEDDFTARPIIRRPETPQPTNGRAPPLAEPLTGNGASLRDILADMDDVNGGRRRGEELVERLVDSGIPLPSIFHSRDGKRLAQAARKSEEALRRAVQDIASKEVRRVAERLRSDGQLMGLARDFVRHEGHEVIGDLLAAKKSADIAKLSAYLLVTAALNQPG